MSSRTHEGQSAWPLESIGHKITTNVPVAHIGSTIAHARQLVEQGASGYETIHYVYVVDQEHKLIGVLSMKELLSLPPHSHVEEACKSEELVTIAPHKHQERAAYIALKHNIKAVPVVDHEGMFLGTITGDTLLHILFKETHEDLMHRAGIHSGHEPFDHFLTMSPWKSIQHRIPWLFLGLLGGIFAAQIIGFFEHTLQKNLILASFIPLIVYMSDAVGTQMEAFIIRDLAIDRKLPFFRYLRKQVFVTVVIGAMFSALLFLLGAAMFQNFQISAVLAVSLFAAISSSVFTGLLIPYAFRCMKMDPANASGPVATILQDLLSIVIYFAIATLLL